MERSMLRSNINGFLALLFVGTFSLGASLIIWHAAFGENPIADVMASQITSQNY